MHPLIIGHENNGRFLQTSPKDAIVLALSLECNFGDCSEQIQIGLRPLQGILRFLHFTGGSCALLLQTPEGFQAALRGIALGPRFYQLGLEGEHFLL